MNKNIIIAITVLVLLIVAVLGFTYNQNKMQEEEMMRQTQMQMQNQKMMDDRKKVDAANAEINTQLNALDSAATDVDMDANLKVIDNSL